jgi:hypothetical protein
MPREIQTSVLGFHSREVMNHADWMPTEGGLEDQKTQASRGVVFYCCVRWLSHLILMQTRFKKGSSCA